METLHETLVTDIKPSSSNPRKYFGQAEHEELIRSVQEKGIIEPLLVRRNGSEQYEIIDGERRYRAAVAANVTSLPCIVVNASHEEAYEMQLISHLQRTNIHPLEEAEAFDTFLGPLTKENRARRKSINELAKKTGKAVSHIAQRLKLLELVKPAKELYLKNVITIEHATLLAKMVPEDQDRALNWLCDDEGFRYFGNGDGFGEVTGKEVAKDIKLFREWIQEEISLNLKEAPFNKEDAGLIPGVPACITCPKNSGYNTALFPELDAKSVCGDRHCFHAKVEAHIAAEKKRIRKEERRGFVMISTTQLAQDDPLRAKDVKMDGRFKIVKEGKECEDTKRAQWIDGPNKGKFTLICNYSKCKKHFGGEGRIASTPKSGSYDDPKQVQKRLLAQAENRFTHAIDRVVELEASKQILKKSKGLGRFELERLVLSLFDANWPADEFFKELYGVAPEKTLKDVKKLSETDLTCVVLCHILSASSYGEDHNEAFAKHYKIDLGGIRKEVEKRVHRCEVCRCSEISACENGCKWSGAHLKIQRYVCSNCTEKAKPITGPEEARAKK